MKILVPAVAMLAAMLVVSGPDVLIASEDKPVTAFPITLMDAAQEEGDDWKYKTREERVNVSLWREISSLRKDLDGFQKEQERLSNAMFFLHRTVTDVQGSLEALREQSASTQKTLASQRDAEIENMGEAMSEQAEIIASLEKNGRGLGQRIEQLQSALDQQTRRYEAQERRLQEYEGDIARLREMDAPDARSSGVDIFAEAQAAPAILLDEVDDLEIVESKPETIVQETLVQEQVVATDVEDLSSSSAMLDERIFDALIEEKAQHDEENVTRVAMPAKAVTEPIEQFAPATEIAPAEIVVAPIEEATPSNVLSANDLVTEGNKFLSLNQIDEAMDHFKHALKLDSRHAGARLSLASCYYTADDYEMAQRHIRELLYYEPNNAQALGLQGIISWRQGDVGTATKSLRKAVKLDPKDAQLRNYMGIVHYARNEYNKALHELRKAVDLDPEHAEARFNLAVLLASSDKPMLVESREHYETALKLGNKRDQQLEELLYP